MTPRPTRGGEPGAPVLRSVDSDQRGIDRDEPRAPTGIQLDLLSAVVRLQQVKACLESGDERKAPFAEWLFTERVLTCDLPRLAGYLTADTRDWAAVNADEFGLPGVH